MYVVLQVLLHLAGQCSHVLLFQQMATDLLLQQHIQYDWAPCMKPAVPLIGWISDTLSQGYTDLQSLVKCLDHRGIVLVLDTVCSQARAVLGCAMH